MISPSEMSEGEFYDDDEDWIDEEYSENDDPGKIRCSSFVFIGNRYFRQIVCVAVMAVKLGAKKAQKSKLEETEN